MTDFAVVFTLKDEAALISRALDYYHFTGARQIYCFFDGSSDHTEEIARRCPVVVSNTSIQPHEIEHRPQWIEEILPRWNTNADVRKRINAHYAARLAFKSGIEWLVVIDPDELFLPVGLDRLERGVLSSYFDSVDPAVDQLLIKNIEAVPHKSGIVEPFAECVYFTRRHAVTHFAARAGRAALRRVGLRSSAVDLYENLLYNLRFRFLLNREFVDPTGGTMVRGGQYIGYVNHKSAIRTSVAADANFNTHEWILDGAARTMRLRNKQVGWMLHYDFYSAQSIRSKFIKREPILRMNGRNYRNTIARLALELPAADFDRFFCVNLVERQIEQKISAGLLQRIDVVQNYFRRAHLMNCPEATTDDPLEPDHPGNP
ncbi:glycosyltransferase family 2 protein [Cereibacter azotoformans]|uniref:Glycosyl transferase family 2 n=1 Tax=Cereibacter azotoformans TaxID=43057 RepID=A0A2T5JSP7_9RHOB|nr:glycosyltransferase family 2 protein [Cereibacter azotoformans]PTR11628.1 glycosyl transferase family 2 [Cereibacter azotoformans]